MSHDPKLIDAVAEQIRNVVWCEDWEDDYPPQGWDQLSDGSKNSWRKAATAALDTMEQHK